MLAQQTESNDTDVSNIALAWHPVKDFLAVSTYKNNDGGTVSLFTRQGGVSFYKTQKRTATRGVKIAWHPRLPLLAVGWDSGRVTVIDADQCREKDMPSSGQAEIAILAWMDSRLLAGDVESKIVCFTVDSDTLEAGEGIRKATIKEEAPNAVIVKKLKSDEDTNSILDDEDNELMKSVSEAKKLQRLSSLNEKSALAHRRINNPSSSTFYIGGSKGGIYTLDEDGSCLKSFICDNASILELIDMPDTPYILASTDSLLFYQLEISGHRITEKVRIKLSGQKEFFKTELIDNQMVALCYGEREIRFWNLNTNDNALFRLQKEKGYSEEDCVTCLSYSHKKNTLSAGTTTGKLARWKKRKSSSAALDQMWKLQVAIETDLNIASISWSPTTAALVVNSVTSVTIFKDEGVSYSFDFSYAVVQKAPQVLCMMRMTEPIEVQDINLPLILKGFRLSPKFLSVWDVIEVHIFEITDNPGTPMQLNDTICISCSAKDVVVRNANVIILTDTKIEVRTFQSTIRQTLNFQEMEGDPVMLDMHERHMVVGTTNGYMVIYDTNEKEFKRQFFSNNIEKIAPEFERFVTLRINSNGTKVSFTIADKGKERNHKIYVWDAENNSVSYFSLATGMTDQQEGEAEEERVKTSSGRPKTGTLQRIERAQTRFQMMNYQPGNHVWDRVDPRYLVCEAIHVIGDQNHHKLVTMYVTSEHGIQMHDIQPRIIRAEQLIAVTVPYLYFLRNHEVESDEESPLEFSISRILLRQTIREFVGIDDTDTTAIKAMLDFSFYLCIGKMDHAFKAIKYIKNDSVWDHMARMCVKTRRIDVARVCLGNMQNARAARNLRLSVERGDSIELQTAQLAIELGMIDEAKAIYSSVGRFDMLNRILQIEDRWDEAFFVAEQYDRIHLRHTHYNYAQYLEEYGAIEPAIENYELSGTAAYEVPRALFINPKVLENYVKRTNNTEIKKWWGHYLESIGEIYVAKNYYRMSDSIVDVVRLLCEEGSLDEAVTLVEETNNEEAALFLARKFEVENFVDDAVLYYTRAHAFGSAIRLAREHGLVDRLANLALQSGGSDLVDAAKFYENEPGHADKAVMLFHKAGMIGKALDLAFETEQHSALDLIVQELDENSDPAVLERAAQFFAKNQQGRKAVELLAYAKKFQEAVQMCLDQNVPITEELAEALTPPRRETKRENEERNRMLEDIARCCLQQRNYHFAAKKFTQAGNKIEAMRALLKSGDTPKIILFANTARNKDIYRMAGNYLQTLPWREDMDVMRSIETFYVKAGAQDALAGFYKACADVEIDEFRDYEKGLAAVSEAVKVLTKKIQADKDRVDPRFLSLRENLDHAANQIKKFVDAKQAYESNPGDCIKVIRSLLGEPGINEAVRKGDLYALLILHYAKRSNFKKAYEIIVECVNEKPRIDVTHFIQAELLDKICDQVEKPRITVTASARADDSDDEAAEEGVDFSHAMRRRQMADAEDSEEGMSD